VKVEAELAEFLNALPNRSEFIRRAILDLLGKICPLCSGRGFVYAPIGEWFRPILDANGDASEERPHGEPAR
jgi:hypothetical protein